MKKCPFCAENIQDDARKCKHCGEWIGPCRDMHGSEQPGPGGEPEIKIIPGKAPCPKCGGTMNIIKRGSLETDECPGCGGIWIDNMEEKEVLKMEPAVFTVDDLHRLRAVYKPEGREEKVKYFKCPRCGKLMWRKNYLSHSGIIVDKCRDHGTFFDKGELEKAIEFIKKGGVEYEKLRITEKGLGEVHSRITREINRVEVSMYRLHWVGRILSLLGF